MEARMPPTLLCPFSASSPRSRAPARNASFSDSSRRKKGTFIRERHDGATRFSKNGIASSAAIEHARLLVGQRVHRGDAADARRCLKTSPAM
jgi:hypothetical protein